MAQKEEHMDIEQIVLSNILCNTGSILEYNIEDGKREISTFYL